MYTAQLQAGTCLAPQRGQVNVLVDGHGSMLVSLQLRDPPHKPALALGRAAALEAIFMRAPPDAETVQLRRWKLWWRAAPSLPTALFGHGIVRY